MHPLRASVAAFCGAIIGGFLAKTYFDYTIVWALGALVGGLAGWVLYAPVVFAKSVADGVTFLLREIGNRTYVYRRFCVWQRLAGASIGATVLGIIAFILVTIGSAIAVSDDSVPITIGLILPPLAYAGVSIIISTLLLWEIWEEGKWSTPKDESDDEKAKKTALLLKHRREAFRWNPIIAPFSIIVYTVIGIGYVLYGIGWVIVVLILLGYRFTVSDGRIAAFIGASVGTTVGYFVDHLLLGGAMGAVVAFLLAVSANSWNPKRA